MLSRSNRAAFQRRRKTKRKALKKYWLSFWVFFCALLEKVGMIVIFWSFWFHLSGMEVTACHKHHGSAIKDGKCISISRLCVGDPEGVQSFLV